MEIYIKNLQKSTRLHPRKIRRDIVKALRLLGLSRAELSVVFVNSERMKRLNALYRGVGKATDVLSFPLWDGPLPVIGEKPNNTPFPLGDIVICVPTALLQAKECGMPLHEETQRLLVHGLLHLAGYDHELNAYQKKKMVRKEREILDALKAMA